MDSAELINRLRDVPCWAIGTETEETMHSAADLIEAQQKALDECAKQLADMAAKVPKEGEWIDAYIGGNLHKRCPRCGTYIEATFFANDYDVSFCPVCGSRMRKGEQE